VLVLTVAVIGLMVGLSEVTHGIVQELNDVGDAIGHLNQSYFYSGFKALKDDKSLKSQYFGSKFEDFIDECDDNQCSLTCLAPVVETAKTF
jgi:hypothetical protein